MSCNTSDEDNQAGTQQAATVNVPTTLMGVHSAGGGGTDLAELFNGQRGYTTEIAWASNASTGVTTGNVQNLVGMGMTVILRLDFKSGAVIPNESEIDEYIGAIRGLRGSLGDAVKIFIVGNEPNITWECGNFAENHCPATHYAEVYRRVRSALYQPGDMWLIAGMSPGPFIKDVRYVAGNEYYRQVLSALSPSEVDGIAFHAYGNSAGQFQGEVNAQLTQFRTSGYGSKPLYLTEMTRKVAGGDAVQEQRSAAYIYDSFTWLKTRNASNNQKILAACWFVYTGDGGFSEYALASLKTPGASRYEDVWYAFQAAVAATTGSAVTPSNTPPQSSVPGATAAPAGTYPAHYSDCPAPCRSEFNNYCYYGPGVTSYCDRDGNGDPVDSDWEFGYSEYQRCCVQ